MRIRHQFVSNSSSTSYIIKVNSKKTNLKCPCCRRSDLDFISYIQTVAANYGGDDTEYRGNKQYIIEQLENEISRYKENIQELSSKNPNSKAYEWSSSITTVIEVIQQNKKQIKKLQKGIKEYSKFKDDEIHYISISYHDSNTNQIFEQCKNNGSIIVLEDFGG